MSFSRTIPRQHGAWSILIASFILGTLLGGRFGIESMLLLLAVLAAFFARYTASGYFKSDTVRNNLFTWFTLYAGIFLLSGVLLVFGYRRWFLIPLGTVSLVIIALSLYLAKKGKDLTLAGEINNILGLSILAPAAEYTAWGIYSLKTLGLWLLCFFFFAGSVFRVRYLTRKRLEAGGEFLERLKAGMPSLVFHMAAFLTTIGLIRINVLPALTLFVLMPVTLRVLWLIAKRYKKPITVRAVGYIEVFHTLLFIVLAVIAFR